MKIVSKKALTEAQALAAIALDEFDMAMANLLLRIAYGHYEIDLNNENSMKLAEQYYAES